tara:strand:+ start:284 stop:535 length:252 start_codon:yes stop_codon:yes gene_type:complete
MLQIIKSLLSLLDILFPATIIEVVKRIPYVQQQLQPIYEGRVLVNESAMNDPIIQATLKEMAKRNFEPLPTPNEGVWNISDRH